MVPPLFPVLEGMDHHSWPMVPLTRIDLAWYLACVFACEERFGLHYETPIHLLRMLSSCESIWDYRCTRELFALQLASKIIYVCNVPLHPCFLCEDALANLEAKNPFEAGPDHVLLRSVITGAEPFCWPVVAQVQDIPASGDAVGGTNNNRPTLH